MHSAGQTCDQNQKIGWNARTNRRTCVPGWHGNEQKKKVGTHIGRFVRAFLDKVVTRKKKD